MKKLVFVVLLAFACHSLSAQFSLVGNDPARVRWMNIQTENFRIIYPVGEDSLARVYAYELERARNPLAWSSGLKTGISYKRTKMPVVLHSFNSTSNAMVAWAPKRMEIYTVMESYSPTPTPWERHLAIHEGRHSAQMQFGAYKKYKLLHYLTGEMFAGSLSGIFPGPAFLEGDAVVAETALSNSGRGRQASFLNYFMPAFDTGDWRNYWRWKNGSFTKYTPDHYRVGYMTIAGTRVFFDDPSFTNEYFTRVVRWPWFFNLQKTIKHASGMKFKDSFRAIEENFHDIWTKEAEARAPFMPSRMVSSGDKSFSSYWAGLYSNEAGIFTVKSGLYAPRALVRVAPDGSEWEVRPFSARTGEIRYDEANGRIWWAEVTPSKRWELEEDSRIYYVETTNPSKIVSLASGHRYFNPSPSKDGKKLAVAEYPNAGGSRLCILDAGDGSVLQSFQAPDSLQIVETAWVGDRVFFSGLSQNGMGVYELAAEGSSRLSTLLEPQSVEMKSLKALAGELSFVCDRTGVNELYLLEPDTRILRQATVTRYGINSPFLNPQADTLYYSSVASSSDPQTYRKGNMIYATAVSDLPMKEVSFADVHKYPVAETLTKQEKELAGGEWDTFENFPMPEISEPEKYSKVRFPHIHSWAPIYFNYSNIEKMSFDKDYETAGLGATILFQNLLGNGYGFVGYNTHEDPYKEDSNRHSLHFRYIYTGLFPVMEFSMDYNDRSALDIKRFQDTNVNDETVSIYSKGTQRDEAYYSAKFTTYIPFNFSSGGISRGLVPQAGFKFSNDRLNDQIALRNIEEIDGETTATDAGTIGSTNYSMIRTLDLSLRGYVIRSKAASQVYPRLGIGAEAGVRIHPDRSQYYSPSMYLYTYGYLPGLRYDQGTKISLSAQTTLSRKEYSFTDGYMSMLPRGFAETNLGTVLNRAGTFSLKATIDYAIPLFSVDWAVFGPLAYIKNFQIDPFADVTFMNFHNDSRFLVNPEGVASETLASFGADLVMNLGNVLWLPFDSYFGVRFAHNWWKDISSFNVSNLQKNYVGVVYGMDF